MRIPYRSVTGEDPAMAHNHENAGSNPAAATLYPVPVSSLQALTGYDASNPPLDVPNGKYANWHSTLS